MEGMTCPPSPSTDFWDSWWRKVGGVPDSHQFWPAQSEAGLGQLIVALSPDLGPLDEERFLEALYGRMHGGGPGLALAARFWKQAGTIRIVREHPRQSGGAKLPPVKRPAQGQDRWVCRSLLVWSAAALKWLWRATQPVVTASATEFVTFGVDELCSAQRICYGA